MPLFVLHRQRADGPAEIVRVHREVTHRLVQPPVFAESVTLPGFASIAMSGGAVLAFQEGRVDRSADFRLPNARITAAKVPKTIRRLTRTTRPLDRIFSITASVNPAGTAAIGFLGRPG